MEKGDRGIIKYNVRWLDSDTKKIYQATKRSEELLYYLENQLFENNLIQLSAENPRPKRGFGEMIYYHQEIPKRKLLTSAPRKDSNYIHVVIMGGRLSRKALCDAGFHLGDYADPTPDVKINSETEISCLVALLKKINYK